MYMPGDPAPLPYASACNRLAGQQVHPIPGRMDTSGWANICRKLARSAASSRVPSAPAKQPSVDERKINSSLHTQWPGLLLLAAPSSRVPITFYYFRYPFAPAAQVFSPPSTWWAFS